MIDRSQFPLLFFRLKEFFEDVESSAKIIADDEQNYLVNAPYSHSSRFNRETFLGGVKIQKNYVSFYLMPIYIYPDLLNGVSPELLKRMQGKSCFNFTALDETLFSELLKLTQRGVQRYKKDGLLK